MSTLVARHLQQAVDLGDRQAAVDHVGDAVLARLGRARGDVEEAGYGVERRGLVSARRSPPPFAEPASADTAASIGCTCDIDERAARRLPLRPGGRWRTRPRVTWLAPGGVPVSARRLRVAALLQRRSTIRCARPVRFRAVQHRHVRFRRADRRRPSARAPCAIVCFAAVVVLCRTVGVDRRAFRSAAFCEPPSEVTATTTATTTATARPPRRSRSPLPRERLAAYDRRCRSSGGGRGLPRRRRLLAPAGACAPASVAGDGAPRPRRAAPAVAAEGSGARGGRRPRGGHAGRRRRPLRRAGAAGRAPARDERGSPGPGAGAAGRLLALRRRRGAPARERRHRRRLRGGRSRVRPAPPAGREPRRLAGSRGLRREPAHAAEPAADRPAAAGAGGAAERRGAGLAPRASADRAARRTAGGRASRVAGGWPVHGRTGHGHDRSGRRRTRRLRRRSGGRRGRADRRNGRADDPRRRRRARQRAPRRRRPLAAPAAPSARRRLLLDARAGRGC